MGINFIILKVGSNRTFITSKRKKVINITLATTYVGDNIYDWLATAQIT